MAESKVNTFIYTEASKHADSVCEKIFPLIKEALMKSYAKGFADASKIAAKYQEKHSTQPNGINL